MNRRVCSLLSGCALVAQALAGEAVAQTPPKPTAPAAPQPAPIPISDVASRAAQVPGLLRTLTAPLDGTAEIDAIRKLLPGVRAEIDVESAATDNILRNQPTLDMIQSQLELWKRRQLQTTEWLTALTRRAALLDGALTRLTELRQTWRETRDVAEKFRAPRPIRAQIDGALAAIEAAQSPLATRRTAVLDLQSVVAQELARAETILSQLAQAQHLAVGGIFVRNRPPLWNAEAWAQALATWPTRTREALAVRSTEFARYVRDPSEGMPLHVGIFLVVLLALLAARRQARRLAQGPEDLVTASALNRPYRATVVIATLILGGLYWDFSPTVHALYEIIGLAAAILLARSAADPRLAPVFYTLLALFAVDSFRETAVRAPAIEQAVLAVGMLAGLVVMGHSLSIGSFRPSATDPAATGGLAAFRVGAGLVTLTFAVALLAGVLGSMRLARLLASGVLGSGALALMLYAALPVFVGLVALALRVWPLRRLQMVQNHRGLLEHRIDGVLVVALVVVWVVRTLNYVGLLQPAQALASSVLGAQLGRGTIRVSVGDVLEFLVTVWAAFLVSAFIRFVLHEDVYPRTRLTRGMAYALSSLLNYVIVALGFLLGLGVLGMDLTKVTILAGAFSVGIGFGLQSVVNNFVSGLILLFERPIHVGDVVEIGTLQGEVWRIGIRASVVRTWQGAEIIVPNAQLITERVTNWTLSDRRRRIDLKVGVDYGSPPQKVVEVLEGVARRHPDISKYPAPEAAFISFGESSINFELRAWTDYFERGSKIQTELAAAVYAAVQEAGMTLPVPQREVRMLVESVPR